MSGFYYRLHCDNESLPDGIIWITLYTRKNLLQYGDIFP